MEAINQLAALHNHTHTQPGGQVAAGAPDECQIVCSHSRWRVESFTMTQMEVMWLCWELGGVRVGGVTPRYWDSGSVMTGGTDVGTSSVLAVWLAGGLIGLTATEWGQTISRLNRWMINMYLSNQPFIILSFVCSFDQFLYTLIWSLVLKSDLLAKCCLQQNKAIGRENQMRFLRICSVCNACWTETLKQFDRCLWCWSHTAAHSIVSAAHACARVIILSLAN